MFDTNFYPTPEKVAFEMCSGLGYLLDNKNSKVLEPSAGKGNLIDKLLEIKKISKSKIYCIEKNKELQQLLKGKEYKVIDSDFLKFENKENYIFSLILMNPPFDHADKHFIKAMEIRKGAEIRCLYPTESIKNPYSKERRLVLDLIETNNGKTKDLGSCFIDSERKTNVEVTLITIPYKELKTEDFFNSSQYTKESYTIEDLQNNQLEKADVIESLVDRYNAIKVLCKQLMETLQAINFYNTGLTGSAFFDILKNARENGTSDLDVYAQLLEEIKIKAWKKILYGTNIRSIVTTKVMDNFEKFVTAQSNMAFTPENIEEILQMIYFNQGNIVKDCIEDVFDYLTSYHEENRIYFEGWKTNKCFKITKRVILPRIFSSDPYYQYLTINWSHGNRLHDIEKALCFLSGKNFTDIEHNTVYNRVERTYKTVEKMYQGKPYKDKEKITLSHGEWHDSEFFRFKGFKKGTLHLEFKDQELYNKFNRVACEGKNWIPKETTKNKEPKEKTSKPKNTNTNNNSSEIKYSTEKGQMSFTDNLLDEMLKF